VIYLNQSLENQTCTNQSLATNVNLFTHQKWKVRNVVQRMCGCHGNLLISYVFRYSCQFLQILWRCNFWGYK